MLFAFRSGCSGALTDTSPSFLTSLEPQKPGSSYRSCRVCHHDLIGVFKASLSFGSAEQAPPAPEPFFILDGRPERSSVLAEFEKCEHSVGRSLFSITLSYKVSWLVGLVSAYLEVSWNLLELCGCLWCC